MFKLVTDDKTRSNNLPANRSGSSAILDKYFSVQFSLSKMDPVYLFKLRDFNLTGLCILVKQDSSVFKQLNVGDILNMEYNPTKPSDPKKLFKTQIISKNCYDRFKGHSLVELSIMEN